MTHPDPVEMETLSPVALDAPPTAPAIGRAVWATRAQFAALGVISGVWGVHIPTIKLQYGLGEMALSGVLLAIALGAVSSLLFAGRVVGRLGVRQTTRAAAALMGLMLAGALQWPHWAWMLPGMVLMGAAMSLFDVAINTEGSALEALLARPIMGNLHGNFSLGGMVGAAIGGVMIRWGWSGAAQLLGVGLGSVLWVWWTARGMLSTHPTAPGADEAKTARFAWPRGTLLVLGLLIFAGMSAEGAMYDWSVLYLQQEVGMAQGHAAWGYAAFSAAMAATRLWGDRVRAVWSEERLLRTGAGTTAVAMTVVLLARDPWVSLIGFACVGAGLALVVPVLYNAATRVPGVTPAAAIASVSAIGYSGFMVGPPLIGGLAQGFSLSAALSVVVVAAGLLAWGTRWVPAPPSQSAVEKIG